MNEDTHPTDPRKARNLLIVRVLSCQDKPADAPSDLRLHLTFIQTHYREFKSQGLSFSDCAEQARCLWLEQLH